MVRIKYSMVKLVSASSAMNLSQESADNVVPALFMILKVKFVNQYAPTMKSGKSTDAFVLQVITEFKEFARNAQTVKFMNHRFKPADQNAKTAKFGSSTNANATPAATSLLTVVKFAQLEPNTMLPHKNVKRSANYPTNNSSTESADALKALSQIKEESVLLKYVLMTVPTTPSPTLVSATMDTI